MNIKEFRINEHLTLRLEGEQTNIYVDDYYFQGCKYLLLDIGIENASKYDSIESIDEAMEIYSKEHEHNRTILDPETEFWGHCSNIQVWAENNYDTRLLDSRLAFPLLKRLAEAGDPLAMAMFKEEVIKRLESGYHSVVLYLLKRNFLEYFTLEEIEAIEITPREKTLKRMTDYGDVWYELGYEYHRHSEYDKARKCFERAHKYLSEAIETSPHVAYVWNRFGNVYYFLGDHEKEDQCYDQAIALNPHYFDPWYNKACIQSIRNNTEKTLEYLEKAITLNPNVKERAKNDPDLIKMQSLEEFKTLLEYK